MDSLISIIVPVYNSEKTLKRCLDSIINQTYKNWQAILIDDGSFDKSKNIIDEYVAKDRRFKYIVNEKNLGIAATRNKALEEVEGEYLAFIDSDDWWESNLLSTLYELIIKYNADISQCAYQYNYSNGLTVMPRRAFRRLTVLDKPRFKKVYMLMLTGMRMNHVCMKLINIKLIKGMKFDTKLKTGEDLAFCVQLFPKAEKYVYTPEPMYHYFRFTNSLTSGSLTFYDKWKANRYVSDLIIKNMKLWNTDNLFYKVLAYLRPYFIIISKLYRTAIDKFHIQKEEI